MNKIISFTVASKIIKILKIREKKCEIYTLKNIKY